MGNGRRLSLAALLMRQLNKGDRYLACAYSLVGQALPDGRAGAPFTIALKHIYAQRPLVLYLPEALTAHDRFVRRCLTYKYFGLYG